MKSKIIGNPKYVVTFTNKEANDVIDWCGRFTPSQRKKYMQDTGLSQEVSERINDTVRKLFYELNSLGITGNEE